MTVAPRLRRDGQGAGIPKPARTARAAPVGRAVGADDANDADDADNDDADDADDAAAPAVPARPKPTAKARPATAKTLPSPSKLSDRRLAEETLRAVRGAGVQHRLGEVEKRKVCNVKGCGNPGARFGCMTCHIHVCSPECYNEHAFDNAELCGKMCATFLKVSKFKDKKARGQAES